MATLTDQIDENRTNIRITTPSGTLVQGDLLRIDQEVVRFLSYGWTDSTRSENTGVFLVDRGIGTPRAVHAAGIAVTAARDAYLSAALGSPPGPFDSSGGASDAASVSYDNAESGLTAEDVQAALDEVVATPPGEGAQLLTDPGEVWEAETVYSAGDRVLVDDAEVFETEDDGESGAEAPDWYTDMGDVIDNEIGWYWLGRVGDLSRGNLPGGLGGGASEFALTTPSAIGVAAGVAMAAAVVAAGLRSGVADPSAGDGLAATLGSLYLRSSGHWYFKYSAADTAWAMVIHSATSAPALYFNSSGYIQMTAGGRIGFYGETPAAQPAAVADATDAASTMARLNDLLARLRTLGLIDT